MPRIFENPIDDDFDMLFFKASKKEQENITEEKKQDEDTIDVDQITDLFFRPDLYGSYYEPVTSLDTVRLSGCDVYSHEYTVRYNDNKEKTILILDETYRDSDAEKNVMHFWKVDMEKLSIYSKLKLMLLGLNYIENYQICNKFDSLIAKDYIVIFKYMNEDFKDDIFNCFYNDLSEIVKTESLQQRENLIKELRNKIKSFINGEKVYQDKYIEIPEISVTKPNEIIKTESLQQREKFLKKLRNKLKAFVNREKVYQDEDNEISNPTVLK